MSKPASRFAKRAWTLAGLLVAAIFCYLAGAATFVGLFIVGVVLELGFWLGLFTTDWKGLRAVGRE